MGYFLCAREFSRLMIRDGIQGRIIQINSKSGKVGSKHNSGYSAAKFGGVGLTQSLALDLAEYGITVHSLMLGNLLKSPMFQSCCRSTPPSSVLKRKKWSSTTSIKCRSSAGATIRTC